MGTRRKSRELALQMLFQADLGGQPTEEVRRTFWTERATVEEETRSFADQLFSVARERAAEIDALIEQHAEHWRVERMAVVDRNLLRAGVAEFLGFPETPKPVIINESLEVARKFSGPESVHFINGVLDGIAHALPKSGGEATQPRKKKKT
jgi:N utilization substance protein B